MKFFGAVLSAPVLEGLLQGTKEGFTGLRVLEFSIDLSSPTVSSTSTGSGTSPNTDAGLSTKAAGRRLVHGRAVYKPQEDLPVRTPAQLAEAIISVAKDRAYVGKNGLSVTVNYR